MGVRPVDEAVAYLLGHFRNPGVHDDVVPGIEALAAGGHRLITLTPESFRQPDLAIPRLTDLGGRIAA